MPGDEFDQLANRLLALLLDEPRLDMLAQRVAGLVLDSPKLRQALREIVLRVTEEQERQSGTAPVREFLRQCEARRVVVEYDHKLDLLVFLPFERLGGDLQAVLRERRAEITQFVKGLR